MNTQKVKVEITNQVALVTISNPPLNSLQGSVLQELGTCIDGLGNDPLVKVIIIAGTGNSFATGADINEMGGVKTAREASAISSAGQGVFTRIEKCPRPVIAAINGFCLGGGLELALSCHLRFASDKSIFGMPEIQIGLLPAFGGSYRLPLDEVKKIALQMAKFSSAAMRLTLETVLNGRFTSLDKTMEAEAEAVGKLYDMNDLREGVHAWIEKRKPEFIDF